MFRNSVYSLHCHKTINDFHFVRCVKFILHFLLSEHYSLLKMAFTVHVVVSLLLLLSVATLIGKKFSLKF